ncbi:MAG: S-layer homology domain-containing protein [Phascolarctobacterium sp.]
MMKKSLVLAMAMALGVTASAYAANPFSDVPAGHWAYDSISKLAAAGVIDGYGDATFGGDKLMTRYEMAQITAKAMAKGANVDKLAAEFAEELDNLGVRVAKLEKKADNVKVAGEVRYHYMSTDSEFEHQLRSRIFINGQINEDWSYTGMLQNIQDFKNNTGDEGTSFKRAFVEGKLGGVAVKAGRYDAFFADGNIYDAEADGLELSYGDKVKLTGFVGKGTDAETELAGKTIDSTYGKYLGAEISAELNDVNAKIGYFKYKDMFENSAEGKGMDNKILYVGADYTVGDVNLAAMYLKGDTNSKYEQKFGKADDDGLVVTLSYKGAEADEVGSWGLFATYYNQGGQTYVAHTTDANTFDNNGFKGYGIGANYTFAKNMVGTVVYYDTENKLDSKEDDQRLWADLTFTF